MFNDKGKSMGLRQLSILIVGLVGLMASAFSFALGLGEVTLKSSYNEPLNAEIRLLQPQNLSAEEMLISLASQEDFTRIGLDRDFFLTDLRFSIVITNPNNAYIKVTSTKPVQEPYLNFLVDLQWPSGRLLREYTVLLDLPVFEAEQPVQVAVAPPVSAPLPVPVVKVVKPVAPAVSPPVSRPAEISPPANAQPLPDRVLASNSSKFSNIEDAADSFIRTLSRQAAERQSSFEIQPPPVAKTEQYVPNKQVAAPVPIKQEDLTSSSTSKKVIRTESITSLASAKQIEARRKELEREGGAPVPRPIESFPLASRPKDSLLVKDGDTLWAIALQLRPSSSVSVQQTMLALQEANPTAFIGNNINLLRKGQVLRAPSLAEIEQTSFKQAVAAVRQQTQAWKQQAQAPVLSAVPARAPKKSAAIKQQGRLTLGSADSKDKGKVVKGAGASGKGESLQNDLAIAQEELDKAARVNSNLKTRVAELEEQIKTLEGLVTLTNDQFKALELTTAKVSQDKLPVNIEAVTATSEQNAPADDSVAEKIVDGQDIDATLTTDTNTSETLIAKIMATVTEHIQLVGIALLALLLLIWFIVRSTNDDGDDDFSLDSDLPLVDEELDSAFEQGGDVNELYDLDDLDDLDDGTDAQTIEAQTEDVVAEAEIYISLGQIENAEELLQKELQQNPENADARIALLKLYVSTQDADAFDDQYAQLLPLGDDAANQQAKELRNQIANTAEFDVDSYSLNEPDLSLEENLVGDLEGVDDLELGEEDLLGLDHSNNDDSDESDLLDLDLDLGEESEGFLEADQQKADLEIEEAIALDLDEGLLSELVSIEPTDKYISTDADINDLEFEVDEELLLELSADADETDVFDLDLDEEFLSELSAGEELEAAAELESDMELPEKLELVDEVELDENETIELDLPLVEPESARDNELVESETLASEMPSIELDEPESELELEIPEPSQVLDNGLDIDLEANVDDIALEEDTPKEALAEDLLEGSESDFNLDLPPEDIDIVSLDKELDEMESLLDQDVSEGLLDLGLEAEPEPEVEIDPVVEDEVIPEGVIDMDLEPMSKLDADMDVSEESTPEEFDLDEDLVETDISEDEALAVPADESGLSDEDLGFSQDSDEVETKLDLARAYIDMGDKEGAEDILQEVIEEGSAEQQQDANTLLSGL